MTDFLTNPKIAKLYADVPQAQLEPYRQFRNEYTYLQARDAKWRAVGVL